MFCYINIFLRTNQFFYKYTCICNWSDRSFCIKNRTWLTAFGHVTFLVLRFKQIIILKLLNKIGLTWFICLRSIKLFSWAVLIFSTKLHNQGFTDYSQRANDAVVFSNENLSLLSFISTQHALVCSYSK